MTSAGQGCGNRRVVNLSANVSNLKETTGDNLDHLRFSVNKY